MPGTTELIIVFGVVVLLFGASRLPKLGGAVGEGIRNFRKGIRSGGKVEEDQERLTEVAEAKKDI